MKMVPAAKVKEAFDKIETNDEWVNAVKSLLIRFAAQQEALFAAVAQLAAEVRGVSPTNGAEVAGAPAAAGPQRPMPPRGGVRLGADGQPVTGAQLAAEEAMDAAAGPPDGSPPPQREYARQNGPQQAVGAAPTPAGSGRPRYGADGKLITDPAQIAAEEAMDAAMGIE